MDAPWALALANTLGWHASARPKESVPTVAALGEWARRAGLASGPLHGDPGGLGRVHELREAVYRVFSAIAAGGAPPEADLAALADTAAEGLGHARLEWRDGAVRPRWDDDSLDTLRWRVADDALDLLRHGDLTRVRECADDRGCGWLFVDASRNRSRRWCSSSDCGNRARVRAYQTRNRSTT
jgi:predicted RNA-binding Zn ribbon-like protein